MSDIDKKFKIRIMKNGPYIVSGNIPLNEKIILTREDEHVYVDGRKFPEVEEYALCRCGKTKNPPYCDGSHEKFRFDGTETASRAKYEERADVVIGPDLDLMDDGRCAYARFCHKKGVGVWELTENSDNPECREEAIQAACDCPTGRLVAIDKTGKEFECEFEPSIELLQDPENDVSGPLFVKGNIPVTSSDGYEYEIRNRVALCRCGKSKNKPFCDATHVPIRYSDGL